MDATLQLSENFVLGEFLHSEYALRHRLPIIPSAEELANLQRLCRDVLQPVRDRLGRMRVTSGLRPPWLNSAIGGSKTSAHMYGCAADVELIDWLDGYDDAIKEIRKLNLQELDQCIYEFPPDGWIHLAVARVGAPHVRRQFLVAKHVEGRVVYEPY